MSPSIWQIIIVVAVVVLLFGAKRIPDLGKSMGEAIRGFKKGLNEDAIDVTDSSKNESINEASGEKTASENSKQKEGEKV
jgi:sec-independent protein translocase protein TatA